MLKVHNACTLAYGVNWTIGQVDSQANLRRQPEVDQAFCLKQDGWFTSWASGKGHRRYIQLPHVLT